MRESPQHAKPWVLPKALFGFQQSLYRDTRRGADDVEITVGAKHQRRWFVQETRLCEESRFFSAALRGYFKEVRERKVHFPEEDPDVFAFWLDWLVHGLVLDSPTRLFQYIEVNYLLLQQLYFLGERLDSRRFRLDLINLVYDYFLHRQPALNFSIETVYRKTFPGNDLRRLTTAYIITMLVEKGTLPGQIWNPPVTCILGFKGLSELICTREVLFELAKEIFEQYGFTGMGFVQLFECERDRDSKRTWADYLKDLTRAREEGSARTDRRWASNILYLASADSLY